MRRIASAAAVLVSLAAATAPAPARAAPPKVVAAVRLVECDATARTADFEGDMRALAGATRLQMRFSLLRRADPGKDAAWARVQAPNLDTWVSAQAGRSRYVYSKHVAGLQPGAVYRAQVRFRWRAAGGEVLRSVTRRSRACLVPEVRANLVPVAVGIAAGALPGRSTYLVTVANRGRSAAPATSVALDVGDVVLADRPAPALEPGARAVVAFDGPACTAGTPLVAGVDATGLVDEAVEADDVLSVPCPAPVAAPYTS